MAYKALYRTYRPKSFEEMVGQKHIKVTIKNAINESKIAHAYLFSGPRGTGKTSMAKLLAKALNCDDDNVNNRPCNHCENCEEINTGSHPDVIEIDAASNNGVDEIREIIDKVKYLPILGKYKVYIIDEVHMLSTGAFNALLKTLEEPPAHVVFILATTDVHKVIPTIVSRCQRFDFGRVSTQDIKERINEVLVQEKIEFENDVCEMIADLAEGGMRDALSILDQAVAYAGNKITTQHIRNIYGIATTQEMIAFLNKCNSNDVMGILDDIKEFEDKGLDFVRLTSALIGILKEVLIYKKTNNERLLKLLNADKANMIGKNITIKGLFDNIDILIDAQANYRRVNTPKDFFQLAALKICELNNNIPSPEPGIIQKNTQNNFIDKEVPEPAKPQPSAFIQPPQPPSTVKEEVETIIVTPSQPQTEPTPIHNEKIIFSDSDILNILVQSTKIEKATVMEKWPLVRKYLSKPAYSKSANMIIEGQPVAVCAKAMLLVFNMEGQAQVVNTADNQGQIRKLLKEIYGKEYYFIGISDDSYRRLRSEFIDKMNSKTLPPPYEIGEFKTIESANPEEKTVEKPQNNENLDYFEKLFGQKIEVEDE